MTKNSQPHLLLMGEYPAADTQALERDYIVHRFWQASDSNALLRAVSGNVRAIATRGDITLPATLIPELSKLEIISCFGVGTDGIDLAAARTRGIRVTNTPDVLTGDVADLALALMLAIARQIPQADAFTRRGDWPKGAYPLLTRMNGKRVGLIGMGRIGKAIAKRAEGFEMKVAYHSRKPNPEVDYAYFSTAVELAQNSDFLVAIVPGGAATDKLVTAEVLNALGPQGFFINVARGSVVDEHALLAALESKSIAGAALDVYLNEPNIDPRFLKLQNIVLHPHGGSATVETRRAMGQLVRDNLAAHFAGRPLLTPVV